MKSLKISLLTITLILLLGKMPIMVLAEEPSLQQWFTDNTYTINVATNETGIETFPPGHYRVTISAEFALYAPNNTFGWYSIATGTYHQLFAGENTTGDTVEFYPTELFGLYLGSPQGTFHTENSRNSDHFEHAWIFQNPKAENGYMIGWEDLWTGGDKDYQDMVIDMRTLRPPHAVFTWFPLQPLVNEAVTFNASGSTPDGGNITSYGWNFGDGNTTAASNPIITHGYSTVGNYTVWLNITNSEGESDAVSHIITVEAPPHAAFSYSPLQPQVNETVTFDASASTPDGGIITSYNWDFGDGNTTMTSNPVITHTYHMSGNYTVKLSVTDSEGKTDSVSHAVTVIGRPHATFTYSPAYPQVNETVTFNASDSTPDGGSITSYKWNFGDGNTTTTSNTVVAHSYSAFGNYTVTLNITDSEGESDSSSRIIAVRAHPHATFTYSPTHPKANEAVSFNASDSTPDGGYITTYAWNFGDGSSFLFGVTAGHNYTAPGTYTVTLNVTDSEGLWDAESKIIEIQPPAPKPQFAVTIQDVWTGPGEEYKFKAPAYGTTFKVQVWITNASLLYGYEFWLEYDPSLIQITGHEITHIHTQDFVALEEVDNATGVYKQAVTGQASADPYNGSSPVATLWFRIINDPCYPYNYTSMLTLNNTKMSTQLQSPIDHSLRHGYFKIYTVQPEISITCEGKTQITNWIVNETFTVDIILIDIVKMKGFYVELRWCDCLETDYQNVEVTYFLPPPYEFYKININNTMLTVQIKAPAEKPAINGTGTILRVTFKAKNPWNGVPPYKLIGNEYLPENCTCKIWIVNGWIDVYCPEYRRMEFYNASYGVDVRNCSYTFTPIPGDMNLDGIVDDVDLSAISQWVGYDSADPEWPDCRGFDLNGDGCVDIFDVVIVSTNFGRTSP